jgi:general secretion pathway protein G
MRKPLTLPEEEGAAPLPCSAGNGLTPLKRSAENGFTLVELMVVIVIIGLLATLVAFTVIPQLGKANGEKAKTDIATLEQAIEMYRLNNLAYPTTSQGLQALVAAPADLADPARYTPGGYIKKLPNDPWGRPYIYASPGQHGTFDISTLGADGAPGGTGENADLGNWQ